MDERERTLRSLALHDERIVTAILGKGLDPRDVSCLDARTQALVRLGALIALDGPVVSYQSCITMALAAGATTDDIVDTLIAVAPITGQARLVAAAPALAAAVGYDLDAAFEVYDNRGLGQ